MVLVQKWPFSQLFFLGNVGLENVFYDILEQKKAFLGYKKKKFKQSKNWHFPKGLTRGFASKMVIFPTSFFWQNWAGKCLLRYSRPKKRLSRKKNHKFIKVKNSYFSKGVNPCFWSKNGRFSNLFLTRIRLGKCLLRYSRTKKRRSRL